MDCIDLLKICGVDMTSTEPVESALEVFEERLDQLEELMVTVQPTTIPRGVDLHLQVSPETYGCHDA